MHTWNVTGSHDKLILVNLMVSGEGLDAHVKTGGESSTRISRRYGEVQEAAEDRQMQTTGFMSPNTSSTPDEPGTRVEFYGFSVGWVGSRK